MIRDPVAQPACPRLCLADAYATSLKIVPSGRTFY